MKLTRGHKTTKPTENWREEEKKQPKYQQQRGNKSIIAQGKQIFISFRFVSGQIKHTFYKTANSQEERNKRQRKRKKTNRSREN